MLVGKEYNWISRIYTTLFWVIAGAALFGLARRALADPSGGSGEQSSQLLPLAGALAALAYYLALPFSVQASRSFQPDPGMVACLVLYAAWIYRWSETVQTGGLPITGRSSWKWAILAGAAGGLAVFTKVIAAYTVGATAIAIVLYTFSQGASSKEGTSQRPTLGSPTIRSFLRNFFSTLLKILVSPQVWAMALLMIAPTAIYYLGWGDRSSEYFSSWTLALSYLLLDPLLYVRWLNLAQNLVGWLPLVVGLAGVLLAAPRLRTLLVGLWLGYVFYGLFLPYQMYTHSYYHLQLIPIVALSLAPAVQAGLKLVNTALSRTGAARLATQATFSIFGVFFILGLVYYYWAALVPLRSRDYRTEPANWQQIASFLPADGKIIGLTQDYGYRLMYYGWRKVILWPNRGEKKLSQLRGSEKEFETYFVKQTADKRYFLITSFRQFDDQPDLKEYLNAHYPILAQGTGYLIFDLASPH